MVYVEKVVCVLSFGRRLLQNYRQALNNLSIAIISHTIWSTLLLIVALHLPCNLQTMHPSEYLNVRLWDLLHRGILARVRTSGDRAGICELGGGWWLGDVRDACKCHNPQRRCLVSVRRTCVYRRFRSEYANARPTLSNTSAPAAMATDKATCNLRTKATQHGGHFIGLRGVRFSSARSLFKIASF